MSYQIVRRFPVISPVSLLGPFLTTHPVQEITRIYLLIASQTPVNTQPGGNGSKSVCEGWGPRSCISHKLMSKLTFWEDTDKQRAVTFAYPDSGGLWGVDSYFSMMFTLPDPIWKWVLRRLFVECPGKLCELASKIHTEYKWTVWQYVYK